MNRFRSVFKPLMWSMALSLAVVMTGYSDGGIGAGRDATPIMAADKFMILTKSAVADVPFSATGAGKRSNPATGDGVGIICAQVTELTYNTTKTGLLACTTIDADRLIAAIGDQGAACTDAAGQMSDHSESRTTNIGELYLHHAVYKKWGAGTVVPVDVAPTVEASAIWIFRTEQGFTICKSAQTVPSGDAPSQAHHSW